MSENYKEKKEFLGNLDDEPKTHYGTDYSPFEIIIHNRLEQLQRELKIEELSAKISEYNHVRIDELNHLLRLIELKR